MIDRGGIRHEQAQQNGFAIGRPRRCELVGHRITGASTSRHGPTTKVRGRVSIVPLDSRAFSKFPSIGYAPSEYRTKPWPQEVLIEGWFPHFAREQDGFRVDGTTDSNTPAPRSLRQRNCGSRHTPLSGDRRIDHLFLTTSIYSRTRVDAGCHNKRIARRWVIVLLDILFHRKRIKGGISGPRTRAALCHRTLARTWSALRSGFDRVIRAASRSGCDRSAD